MSKFGVSIVFFILLSSLVLPVSSAIGKNTGVCESCNPFDVMVGDHAGTMAYFVNESLAVSDPHITQDDDFISIAVENATIVYEIGKPMLPVLTKCFAFPLGTSILDVMVDSTMQQYPLSAKVYPCQPPSINGVSDHVHQEDIVMDETVYCSDQLYPTSSVTITQGAGVDKTEHVLFVTVRIMAQYNPVKNNLCIPKMIDISVCYSPPKQPLFTADAYDMIIITPELFVDTLQPLVDHKNTVGIRTLLITTTEIYSHYDGRDDAERIKYCIKNAIEEYGIHYVLLVGDVEFVPMRKSDVTVLTLTTIWKGILTDLYYADMYDRNGSFSSWDSDNDGVYGKCRFDFRSSRGDINVIDTVDLYPDVGVGRLPCSTTAEVQIVVDKIIQYETGTYGADWFKRILLMGGDTFASPNDNYYEGEYVEEHYISPQMQKHGFEPVRLFTSLDTFHPEMINTEITKGVGFVSYAGHGNTYRIATFLPNDAETRIPYEIDDIEGMNNNDKLPIFYLDACLTGKLDYNILDKGIMIMFPFCLVKIALENIIHPKIMPCFAWSILKKPSGGGVGVIASSQPAMEGFTLVNGSLDSYFGASLLHRYFFDAYEPGITFSDMFLQAQNTYINKVANLFGIMWDYNTIHEFNLLGDPSLKIGGYPS